MTWPADPASASHNAHDAHKAHNAHVAHKAHEAHEADDAPAAEAEAGVRLQRVLARAGVASRRAAERLIEDQRVTVNGQLVREQGVRVRPETDVIRVDGHIILTRTDLAVLAVNKERGVVTTMSDDRHRPCVGDYLPVDQRAGFFHVGRLDADTEGLLLLTNDGELAHRLTHPSRGVVKTYLASVYGKATPATARRLLRGLDLEDGPARADKCRLISRAETPSGSSLLEITLHEGRNRIVRRMCEAAGHPVERLVRTGFGPLSLGRLRPGEVRTLGQTEMQTLYQSVDITPKPSTG